MDQRNDTHTSPLPPGLKRSLNLFDLTMIATGSVIGSGIFLTPSLIASKLPSPFWMLSIWILGGVMALTGALTFAELGAMMPHAGGVYVYLSETYGQWVGFLYGWSYFLVTNTGGIAALGIAFATYLGYFIELSPTEVKAVAIGGIAFLTILNVRGVKVGAIFSDLFTLLKLIGICGLIVVGLAWKSSSGINFSAFGPTSPTFGISALAVAMVGVIWSCGGWQHASFTAGEAKTPQRDVPLSMILGALIVMVIYVLTNIAYLRLLTPAQMAAAPRVASAAMEMVLGPVGGSLIALVIFISTFGTAGIYTMTAPRIYFAMARDKIFFQRVADIHPRYRTPAVAIVLQSLWAVVLILFWGTFENLISYVVFTDAIFFALTALAVFILRWRCPDVVRPYRTFGYPITPIFFIALEVWFVVTIIFEKPAQSLAGIGFLLLGIPVYFSWRRKQLQM
ncbi:MAG: amino acid permease [candidate division KSB1 bacterium]|nr:amino acid permease [candidate division KSB1 bacterium]MDZ7341369.1 amino acid permease [candidate division KSB1 bacterium]